MSVHQLTSKPAGWSRLSSFWRVQIIGWGLFAIIDFADRQIFYDNFGVSIVLTAIVYPTLVLASAGLREIYVNHVAFTRLSLRTLGLIALLSIVFSGVISGFIALVRWVSGWSVPFWSYSEELLVPFIHYAFVLASWSILFFWVHTEAAKQLERRRAITAEADALRAEISQLRLQLEPHFLFNALNGVIEEIREGSGAALPMMKDLTAYLRHSLAGVRTIVVPARDEADGLSAYLAIQKDRFGDRIRSVVEVNPAAANWPIAHFLLQPLVENAVKHGDRRSVLEISVGMVLDGTTLKIEIANTGQLKSMDTDCACGGIGLANVRRRLEVHYPDRHVLALRQISSGNLGADRVLATLLLEGEPCSAF